MQKIENSVSSCLGEFGLFVCLPQSFGGALGETGYLNDDIIGIECYS